MAFDARGWRQGGGEIDTGYSPATLRQAFRQIGGRAVKLGSGWAWTLAQPATLQDAQNPGVEL
jgi:hypothetical protein